jgi:NarL family two-component system response regulator YdfI
LAENTGTRQNETKVTRVLVAAGYASLRAGLHALLAAEPGVVVIGDAPTGGDSAFARLLSSLRPDVVLLDTSGDSPTNDSLPRLLTALNETKTDAALVVLGETPERHLPRLQQSDLLGWAYLLREAEGPQISAAVRAAANGLVVLDRGLSLPDINDAGPEESGMETVPRVTLSDVPGENLTPREVEVLQLMAEGLPNKIIAVRLKISLHTAKFHVAQILAKLGATSRTEAVTLGARRGYVLL